MSKDLSKLPYFEFVPTAWLHGDITLKDLETQGLYINICSLYWFNDCSMAIAKIKRRLTIAYGDIEEPFNKLLQCEIIEAKEDGNLAINFLDEQYKYVREHKKIQSENGRKGGIARAKKQANSSTTKAPLNQKYSKSQANSSQPSESENEKEKERIKKSKPEKSPAPQPPKNFNSKYNPQINEPTPVAVMLEAKAICYPMNAEEAQKFLNFYGKFGWEIKGSPIRDWRKLLPSWKSNESNFKNSKGSGDSSINQFKDSQSLPQYFNSGTIDVDEAMRLNDERIARGEF
jgi:hypothetical protein